MANRKKATDWFINKINEILPDNKNVEMYKTYLEGLSNKAFENLMDKLESGESILPFYLSNLNNKRLKVNNLLKVGDGLGIDFFQQIWLVDELTGVKYLTPNRYLILDLPIRRQIQHLIKKKSVPINSKFTDSLTGQVTGVSKSSRLSLPEIMILESAGHLKSIEEFIKVRGGDITAIQKSKRSLVDTGEYNLHEIEELGTRPTSTDTVRAYLLAAHLDNNI